jgi:hypothetical protein
MTEKQRAHSPKSSATEAAGFEILQFAGANWESFLEAQRNGAEAVAAAYRKAFEGYAKILALQSELARLLIQQAAGMSTDLYRQPDQSDAPNKFAEATRSATDAIVRSTREIMETACECCVDTMDTFRERATVGKSGAAESEAQHAAS